MIIDNKFIYKLLENIFQIILDDDKIKLNKKTTSKDIKAWDSLTHINLILSIEKKFNFRFLPNDIYNIKNIEDLVMKISQNINEK